MTKYKTAVLELLARLSAYYRIELSDVEVELYLEGLETLGTNELKGAGKLAIKRCRFMPKVSELLELSEQIPPVRHGVGRQLGPRHMCTRCGAAPHDGSCEVVPLPPEVDALIARLGVKMRLPS